MPEDAKFAKGAAENSKVIAAALVFTAAIALYGITLAPTVTFIDSGELIVAARTLGVAHPPGFPLYLLLAHFASIAPVGNVGVRIHLVSAVFAALAAAVMTLLISELVLTREPKETRTKKKKKNEVEGPDGEPSAILSFCLALFAGLLFAFSRTLWAYATIAEVYTLNAFLIVTILWLMFAWRRNFFAASTENREPSYQKLYFAAFIFGLAMGVHHVTVGLFLPSLAMVVYGTAGRRFYTSNRFLCAALIAIAGLSIYVYLPLAASRSPLIDWGEPRTLDAIWRHVTGQQYQVYFEFSATRLVDSARLLGREFGVVWLPAALILAVAGLIERYRRSRTIFWFLLLVILFDVAYCLFYGPTEDKDAYYMPAFISLVIAVSYGVRWATQKLNEITRVLTPARSAGILLAVPVIALVSNFAYNNRHRYYLAHDYVDNVFASVEPRGMVLTSDWQVYSPSLYVREIEGERKDIIFLDINLLRRSWYFSYLEQAYPDMMSRSRDKVNAFLADVRAWERDPAAYDRNPALKQRINTRFQEMVLSFINEQLRSAPLYVTFDLANPNGNDDLGLVKLLKSRYDIVPQGLVFRVAEKGSPFITPPWINIRGLNDGTFRSDYDDIVQRSVIPTYVSMLSNTGIYLASNGRHREAIESFHQALTIMPTFEPAIKGLAASQAALQNP